MAEMLDKEAPSNMRTHQEWFPTSLSESPKTIHTHKGQSQSTPETGK